MFVTGTKRWPCPQWPSWWSQTFFLASQMPLHSELMILETCQAWPRDLVPELKLPVLCCFSSAWPYTDAHLPHPWGLSIVPCHRHSIWLPIKNSVSPASLEVSQLPLLSRSLKGRWNKAVPSTNPWGSNAALGIFPSWKRHLSTTFCFLCFKWLPVAKRTSSTILQQWNFFITFQVGPCQKPFENPGQILSTWLLLPFCNSNRLMKQDFPLQKPHWCLPNKTVFICVY